MKKHLPILSLLFAACAWGIALPLFKAAVHIPPFSYAAIRFVIAFGILCPWYILQKRYQAIQGNDLPRLIFAALFATTLNIGFLYLGLHHTSADDAALLSNLSPIMTIFGAALFLHEPLTKQHVIAAAIALFGVAILFGSSLFVTATASHIVGNGLIIIAALFWAGFKIVAKPLLNRYSVITLCVYYFLIGFLSFLPLAVWEYMRQPNWIWTVGPLDLVSVLFYAIFGSLLAYLCYNWGLAKLGADTAAATEYLIPIVSVIAAVFLLAEHLTPGTILGGAFILLSVFVATAPSRLVPMVRKQTALPH